MFKIKYKKYYGIKGKFLVENTKKEEYDSIPIEFCTNCLSINLYQDSEDSPPYCRDCSCSQFGELNVRAWRRLYYHKYHYYYGNNRRKD